MHHSPISRITILILVLWVAAGCDKLGPGRDSPTAPSGPPAPGSTIVYDASERATATASERASSVRPSWTVRMAPGYPQVATRQAPSLTQRQAAQRAAVGMTKAVVNALVAQNVMSIVPNP